MGGKTSISVQCLVETFFSVLSLRRTIKGGTLSDVLFNVGVETLNLLIGLPFRSLTPLLINRRVVLWMLYAMI